MVGYSSSTGKYLATISILGKLIFIGEYQSYKEAKMAEKNASREADDYLSMHLTSNCINS